MNIGRAVNNGSVDTRPWPKRTTYHDRAEQQSRYSAEYIYQDARWSKRQLRADRTGAPEVTARERKKQSREAFVCMCDWLCSRSMEDCRQRIARRTSCPGSSGWQHTIFRREAYTARAWCTCLPPQPVASTQARQVIGGVLSPSTESLLLISCLVDPNVFHDTALEFILIVTNRHTRLAISITSPRPLFT